MVEGLIIEYLNENLSCGAYDEIPEKAPEEFVVVQKTGSSRVNRIDSATFALQSYSASKLEAALLNEEVKKAMDKLVELPKISKSALNGDYDFTDSSTKRYRYQAIYQITHY